MHGVIIKHYRLIDAIISYQFMRNSFPILDLLSHLPQSDKHLFCCSFLSDWKGIHASKFLSFPTFLGVQGTCNYLT